MSFNNEWQSLHIFLIDTEKQNEFLSQCIYPRVKELLKAQKITQWFFMKYWEGGPHLRLRLKAINSADLTELKQQLLNEVEGYCSNISLSKDDFYRHNKFDGDAVDREELPWYQEGCIENITYKPEYERYGGKYAMEISEQLFHVSSECAQEILNKSSLSVSDKVNLGFDLLLTAYVHLSPDNRSLSAMATFFDQYAKFYARFIDDVTPIEKKLNQYVIENKGLLKQKLAKILSGNFSNKWLSNTSMDSWLTTMASVNKQWQTLLAEKQLITPYFNQLAETKKMREIAISSLASSHLHMMNNRLSIVPPLEYQAALLISLAAKGAEHE